VAGSTHPPELAHRSAPVTHALPVAQAQAPTRTRRRPRLEVPDVAGLAIILIVVVAAIGAPWLAPYSPLDQDLLGRLKPPLWVSETGDMHILGTDELGRDILSRLIYGSRVTVLVVVLAVPISATLGITLGVSAGFIRGAYEDVIMRILDIQLALPFMLLALAVLVVIGPSFTNIVLLLGITGWTEYARILRAETLSLREREFVLAARMVGSTRPRMVTRHVLPNLVSTIIVLVCLQIPHMILIEAALSFLGLGIQPPAASWGGMLSNSQNRLFNAWWVAFFPGLAISLVVLGGNLVGDWLSRAMDPHRMTGTRKAAELSATRPNA